MDVSGAMVSMKNFNFLRIRNQIVFNLRAFNRFIRKFSFIYNFSFAEPAHNRTIREISLKSGKAFDIKTAPCPWTEYEQVYSLKNYRMASSDVLI